MAQLLEILGASAIGGFIIFMMLNLNMNINTSAREIFLNTNTQRSAATTARYFEYHLYKIGYRTTGDKILLADSIALRYRSDFDNNGTVDTVYYYLGTKTAMGSTPNPNDRQLFRRENNAAPGIASVVTQFRLTYFDSSGTIIPYSSLGSSAERRKIRTVRAYIRFELPEPSYNQYNPVLRYNPVEWQKIIRPKNLQ